MTPNTYTPNESSPELKQESQALERELQALEREFQAVERGLEKNRRRLLYLLPLFPFFAICAVAGLSISHEIAGLSISPELARLFMVAASFIAGGAISSIISFLYDRREKNKIMQTLQLHRQRIVQLTGTHQDAEDVKNIK